MDLSRFSVVGEKEQIANLKLQKARLIRLRWFYISLLATIAAVTSLIAGKPWSVAQHYLTIGLVVLVCNAVLMLINRGVSTNLRVTQAFLVLQLILDLTVAAYVTYDQGGLDARTTALFVLPIIAAGLLFTESIVYLTALLAGLGYILSVLLAINHSGMPLYGSSALVPLAFYPAFYLILARLVIYLMRVYTNDTREQAYDAFLALLTHQLKHPASTAGAIIDQLEHSNPQSPEEQQKYIDMLKVENQNLMQLLNNLIETAATPKPVSAFEDIDLPNLLQKLAYRSAENHSRSEDLKLNLEDMSLPVQGDSEKLSTAFTNILDNAFQYSQSGTPVTVDARKAGGHVVVKIEDSGTGMSKETKANLFQKYTINQSTDHGIQGLGLGLFVARKIVTSHNGSLHVVTDNKGTKVMVTLKRGNNRG
ncbi:MAG TPA: HAMP domain-containing sensor histidine kinase [Candidatus Saccharimonadales bacterium]|nr:HAMP domain-containing sensor histidine kinase [Candidatus Saccharimonadales bacterium]